MKKAELIKLLRKKGFDYKLLRAFQNVQREKFIGSENESFAYKNEALPIPFKQSISQPYTIAFMLDLLDLKDGQRILEVGSGSGYVLALINHICPKSKVYGIERIKELKELSEKKFEENDNTIIFHGDGSLGYELGSPYDRILVSASATGVPRRLLDQLKFGGVMIIPIRESIYRLRKGDYGTVKEEYPGFRFVPLKKGLRKKDRRVWGL